MSWTYKCKTFIVILLTVIILSILSMVMYEVFNDKHDSEIAIPLIAVLSSVIPILGFTLKWLLQHDREKKDK